MTLDSVSATHPKFACLANNTAVSHDYIHNLGYRSTLGGIVALAVERWESQTYWYLKRNTTRPTYIDSSGVASSYDIKKDGEPCYSTRDPRDDVMQSLNKLMVSKRIGGQATKQQCTNHLSIFFLKFSRYT